jgi:hypothetical protein
VFFFKSSVIREEIVFVNFKFSFSIRAIWFALLCYVPKKKNLGRLIYRNDADVLGSCHSLFLANHRSLNQKSCGNLII